MSNRYFKILFNLPDDGLPLYLKTNLVFHNLDLYAAPNLSDFSAYVKQFRPHLSIIFMDQDPQQFEECLHIIRDGHQQSEMWFLVLYDHRLPIEKIRSNLPGKRVFLLKDTTEHSLVAHNILTIKELVNLQSEQKLKHRFEESFNQCLQVIYQERYLNRTFERLINILPKTISLDYWAIFTLNPQMTRVEYFSQFMPPTRRRLTTLLPNLSNFARAWLKSNKPFLVNRKSRPEVIEKFSSWGWPLDQLYFLPLAIKGTPIGGLLVGCDENRQLDAQELHFLNEVLGYLGRRIRDEHLSGDKQNDINAFSDELISEKLDEDAIFERACKTISEVTNADSAIFWQYNKGFGFLFPKFFHFREGNIRHHASDKSMIFPEKDGFLTEMLKQNEVRAVENIIDHSQLSPTSAKTFSELHYRNVLVTPVKMGNTLSGLLIANKTDSDRQFSVWELHKAGEIVDRIRQVVRGVRTVKEANLQLKQLSRIFELGHEIKLDLAQEDILNRIVRSVRKGLGWNDVAILVKDELGASLQVSAKAGFSRPHNTGIDLTNSMALAAFETFLEKCQGLGNGYFYRTPEQVQPGVEAPGKSGMSGEPWKDEDLVIFPLETRGDLYGFLMVADPVNRLRPTQENISPLEYYANQSAVAIANMVLYEQLKASQQRYRSLAETMSLGLITCDLEDKVLYVNPAVRELLGKENRELIGMPLGDLFTPKSAQELQEMRETLLATESDAHTRVENLELEIVSVKADKIPVSTFAFPLFERRERSGYFLIINDLRVIKRLERMKADFNSMIVHDLRSPMNVIQGFIELIRNRVVGEINIEQEELLDIAKENVKKVLTLVDNFLIASKLDVGKFNIDPKLDEINTLIEKQVDNHRVLLKNKQITIEKDLDANLPLLFFDSLRIEQVLNNLFSNALKFTPEKGKVFVSTRLEKRNIEDNERFFARISVRDTGVGIPAHQIASIFEKYEQADENQSFNVRGTGLGLSICKEIVDLHGGEIWVESSQKDGSDFIFTLPIESSIEKIVN